MGLFTQALKQVQVTWQKYIAALCVLQMSFIIDALNHFQFLLKTQEIQLAGFKVVRESISMAFGLLFCVFVAAAFYQSGNLKLSSQALTPANSEALRNLPELHLWLLSPFSPSRFLRIVFWGLFLYGYFLLAEFSIIHLTAWNAPDPARMPQWVFRSIGALDLALFGYCLVRGWQLHQNLKAVRATLLEVTR